MSVSTPPVTLSSRQVCEQAGISYRQLTYWISKGWIADPRYERHSGVPLRFPVEQVRKINAAVELINEGYMVEAAFKKVNNG